jgi:outer membrane protein assembly factor BamA
VIEALGLRIGQIVGREEMEAARQRLLDTEAFVNVGYRYSPAPSNKGYALSYEVTEAPDVFPFRFERLTVSSQTLQDALKRSLPMFSLRLPATPSALQRYTEIVEAVLASHGKPESVTARLMPDDYGEMAILISPSTPLPVVAQVQFTGNSTITSAELQRRMAEVAVGIPYTESRFRQLLDANIRPLYEAEGRLRVSFPQIKADPAKDVTGVAVEVQVFEGDVFSLDKVSLDGAGSLEQDLLRIADFRTGETAGFDQINAGLDRIKARLRRDGYLHADTSVDRDVRDSEKKTSLVVHILPGPPFVFGALIIDGLDINGEAAVRRAWQMRPGDPFNADYPDLFVSRIREDGLFDNLGRISSATRIDEHTLKVEVTLAFEPPDKPKRSGVGARVPAGPR